MDAAVAVLVAEAGRSTSFSYEGNAGGADLSEDELVKEACCCFCCYVVWNGMTRNMVPSTAVAAVAAASADAYYN